MKTAQTNVLICVNEELTTLILTNAKHAKRLVGMRELLCLGIIYF